MSVIRATPEEYFGEKSNEDAIKDYIFSNNLPKAGLSDGMLLFLFGIMFLGFLAFLAYLRGDK